MSKKTKVRILAMFTSLILFLGTWQFIDFIFDCPQLWMLAAISVLVSRILTPAITTVDTQSGSKLQVKWIFYKKAVLL